MTQLPSSQPKQLNRYLFIAKLRLSRLNVLRGLPLVYVSLGKEVQKITSLTGCMDEQLDDFLRYDLVKEVRLIAIPAGSLKMIIPGPNYCY